MECLLGRVSDMYSGFQAWVTRTFFTLQWVERMAVSTLVLLVAVVTTTYIAVFFKTAELHPKSKVVLYTIYLIFDLGMFIIWCATYFELKKVWTGEHPLITKRSKC